MNVMSSLAPDSSGTPVSKRRGVVAVTIGNALEFFDFTVYGFLAPLIGRLFFPGASPDGQLLLAVATFGVGFVARPLGGLIVGLYADRAGRKAAMSLSIATMSVGCGLLAFTPTYAQIGLAAPLVVLVARLLQGFSAGGEVGASTALLVEYSSDQRRGFTASWQYASQGLGILAGALLVSLLSWTLTPQAMDSWGWRIPFVLGLSIGPLGFYIRRNLYESLEVTPTKREGRARKNTLWILLTEYRRLLAAGILLNLGGSACAYVVTFYLPNYAVRELGLASALSTAGAALVGFLIFALSPIVGRWSDRVGRKILIVFSRMALVILVYPAFVWLISAPSAPRLLGVMGLLGVMLVVQSVPAFTVLPEMFPKAVRASGVSMVYSTVAVFGGLSPLIVTWLVNATADKFAPAWFLIITTLVSLLGIAMFDDRTGQSIDPDTHLSPAPTRF